MAPPHLLLISHGRSPRRTLSSSRRCTNTASSNVSSLGSRVTIQTRSSSLLSSTPSRACSLSSRQETSRTCSSRRQALGGCLAATALGHTHTHTSTHSYSHTATATATHTHTHTADTRTHTHTHHCRHTPQSAYTVTCAHMHMPKHAHVHAGRSVHTFTHAHVTHARMHTRMHTSHTHRTQPHTQRVLCLPTPQSGAVCLSRRSDPPRPHSPPETRCC